MILKAEIARRGKVKLLDIHIPMTCHDTHGQIGSTKLIAGMGCGTLQVYQLEQWDIICYIVVRRRTH